jgi:hypothetical protein
LENVLYAHTLKFIGKLDVVPEHVDYEFPTKYLTFLSIKFSLGKLHKI